LPKGDSPRPDFCAARQCILSNTTRASLEAPRAACGRATRPMISLGRAAPWRRAAGRASLLLTVSLLAWGPVCDARNVAFPVQTNTLASRHSAQQMADMQLLQQFASSELQHRRRRHLQQVKFGTLRACLFKASSNLCHNRLQPATLTPEA